MKLCMGCMSEIEDRFTTCPYCGFNEAALQQESYYLAPGTVVGGKYIVGKVLRYGGHTVSYLGMDAEVNRKVMVKEYLPSDFSTRSEGEQEVTIYSGDAKTQFEQGLTSFLNEANKLQSLGSMEGIARVYDCVSENDTGYVITEYVEGRTLKEILASGKRYGTKEAVTLLSPILKALERVHAMRIIHCDISPETIMVADTGEAKLVDFGATRYVTTANSKSLAIILKQGYAPEEQYRSSGNRGSWTDVYAVAAVMYRMITGRTPQESVERALVDELKEPSKLGVSIPANVENALMNALNVEQKERTATAGAFLQELNAPSVKRIKTAKKKKETGKFPIWAKGLVAALLCVAVTGGFVVYRGLDGNVFSSEKTNQVMDFKKYEMYEEAEDWMNKNLPDVELKKGYMYSDKKEGSIVAQSIDGGTPLSEVKDDDELIIYVASKDRTSWRDIKESQANAVLLKEKMDKLLQGKLKPMEPEDKKQAYGEILTITLSDGSEIIPDEIENDNFFPEIEISNIEEIQYCATEFFCWGKDEDDKLGNYEKKDINEVTAPMYRKDIEEKYNLVNGASNVEGTSIVDDSYYTYHGDWKTGYICKQTYYNEDGKLDMSKPEDMAQLPDGKLFYVIKESICLKDTEKEKPNSATIFQNRIKGHYGFKDVKLWKDGKEYTGNPGSVIADENKMMVVDENGEPVDYFKEEDMEHLTYRIAVQEKPGPSTQKTQPTNPSTNQSDNGIIDNPGAGE